MEYRYRPVGVCSQEIIINVENEIIEKVEFIGGCPGNTVGVATLLKGMKIDEAISKLKGIDCRGRGTSCPDQLARALEKIKSQSNNTIEIK